MKLPVINDSHFGVRLNAPYMIEYQKRFFQNIFFPYCVQNKIKHIINLGDIFDDRKKIDINTLNEVRQFFFDELVRLGITMYVLPGNHDVYHKNSNDVNSLRTLLGEYEKNVRIYDKPYNLQFGNKVIKMVPWINSSNYQQVFDSINKLDADILCGHFEIAGFKMNGGSECIHGMHESYFPKEYDYILSGHFHSKSTKGNIHYLGAQYEMTWIDHNEEKGFHVYDIDDGSLSFIPNPETMYEKIYYNDTVQDYSLVDVSQYEGKIIRLHVINKTHSDTYDKFIDRMNDIPTVEFKIVEDFSAYSTTPEEVEIMQNQSTKDLIMTYIDDVDSDLLDKDKLKGIMGEVYVEALNIGEFV